MPAIDADPYKKATFSGYIETVLREAAVGTGKKVEANSVTKEMQPLRPFFVFSLSRDVAKNILQPFSNPPTKKQWSLGFAFRKAWTYLFHTKLNAAKGNLSTTIAYANLSFSLQVDHYNLKDKIKHPVAQVSENISNLVKKIKPIDERRVSDAEHGFYSKCFGAIGAVAWPIGHFTPAPWLVTVGKIFVAISAVWGIGNWIYHRGDSAWIKNEYEAIGKEAEGIRQFLFCYDEDMKLNTQHQEYAPLYFPVDLKPLDSIDNDQVKNIQYSDRKIKKD